jgi:alpha/beta superfamily hydrolase
MGSLEGLLVQVVPGADHFFHRKLHCIRQAITSAWYGVEHEHEHSR